MLPELTTNSSPSKVVSALLSRSVVWWAGSGPASESTRSLPVLKGKAYPVARQSDKTSAWLTPHPVVGLM